MEDLTFTAADCADPFLRTAYEMHLRRTDVVGDGASTRADPAAQLQSHGSWDGRYTDPELDPFKALGVDPIELLSPMEFEKYELDSGVKKEADGYFGSRTSTETSDSMVVELDSDSPLSTPPTKMEDVEMDSGDGEERDEEESGRRQLLWC